MLSTNAATLFNFIIFGSFLIFVPSIWTEDKELIYEKDNPIPNNNVAAEKCFYHLNAIKWTCFEQGAKEYLTTMEKFLYEWPNKRAECCAVITSFECLNKIKQFEEECQDKQILEYYAKIQSDYRENGCERYYPPAFQCNNSMSIKLSPILVGLVLLIFSSFAY